MDHKLKICALLINICTFMILTSSYSSCIGNELEKQEENEEKDQITKPYLKEMPKSLFYASTSSPTTKSYWVNLRTMLKQTCAYFFPPNLDFRGSEEEYVSEKPGEKVKKAVAKSLEKSKETVEDSAKSAAQLASDTVQKTTQMLQKTLSD